MQNADVRLITCSRKYDHVTPVLSDLHGFPVKCMSILNSEACCSLSRLYTYKHPPKFKIWWLAIHRPELSSHLVQYAWILLTLVWSTMGLELSLSLLLTCGTTYLTTSVYVTIKYIYYSFKIFLRFWLAKSTRIIHHNHLLMTKFGRIL